MKNLRTIFITLALFLMSFSLVNAAALDSITVACPSGVVIKAAAAATDVGKVCVIEGSGKCNDGSDPIIGGSYQAVGATSGCTCSCTGSTSDIGGLSTTSLPTVIGKVVTVILGLSGFVALIFTIWGGVEWMLSQGDPEKIKTAKNRIINGAIGIIIILCAYGISSFVIGAITKIA